MSGSIEGEGEGEQVAAVNTSISLRMKKRGSVPPRFSALQWALALHRLNRTKELQDIRSQEGHIRPPNQRI